MSADIYQVFYVIEGSDVSCAVDIAKNRTVFHLKQSIKTESPHTFKDIDASCLILYYVDIPDDNNLLESLKTKPLGPPLPGSEVLADVFRGVPKPKTVHFLVKIITIIPVLPSVGKRKRSESDSGDYDAKRAKNAQDIPSIQPSIVRLENMIQRQKHMVYNRPIASSNTIPIELVHEVFATFLEDCQQHKPTKEDNKWLLELRLAMLQKYPDEGFRCDEFRNIFQRHTGIQITAGVIGPSKYQTDGHVAIGRYFLLISEGKNEWVGLGADPQLQAYEYYINSLKQPNMKFKGSPLPCLIIYYVGAMIGFAGAVSAGEHGHPQFEALTPLFDLATNEHKNQALKPVARALGATRAALAFLQKYYDELQKSPPSHPLTAPKFPSRNYFTNTSGAQVVFDYQARLDDTKLLFRVSTGEDQQRQQLIVKFTETYSKETHEYCDLKGIAPKLHTVEKLKGGWMIVVMEYLDAEIYTPLRTFLHRPEAHKTKLRAMVTNAVSTLHEGGFVHGDIRDINVMVRRNWAEAFDLEEVRDSEGAPDSEEALDLDQTCGSKNVMLLDLDWAGLDGSVEYPANINYQKIRRPDEARDGEAIRKAHDIQMVEFLLLPDLQ